MLKVFYIKIQELILQYILNALEEKKCILPFFCMYKALDENVLCMLTNSIQFSSVQLLSPVRLFAIPWTAAGQVSLSITNSQSLPKLISIESAVPSNHLIHCHPLLLLSSIFPSIKVISNESALCIMCPKDWSFSFNFSPSNEHPGLTSIRMNWLDLLAVQGTLKSLLNTTIQKHQFFSAQFSL